MIDLHCHLLPGVDDGAATVADAIALVKMAADDGVQQIVLTPHIHPGRYDNSLAVLQPVFAAFEQTLLAQGVDVKLSLAAEVRICTEMLQWVAQKELPFLGMWQGKQVVLLELPHSHIPPGADKLVQWLLSRQIVPMIAHPERNKAVMDNPAKLQPFIDMGCLFQLTAMSVTGDFGAPAHQVAQQLLEQRLATVVASDAHNATHRPPILSRALAAVEAQFGQAYAQQLFFTHPASIVNGAGA